MKIVVSRYLAFLAGAVFLASAVSAQQRGPGRPVNPFIAVLDQNSDGELSAEEISRAATSLLQLDRNRDGQISVADIQGARGGGGAAGRGGPGGRGPGGGGPSRGSELVLVPKFDTDGNGRLLGEERKLARAQARKERGREDEAASSGELEKQPRKQLSPGDVKEYLGIPVYDTATVRTFFIELPQDDWESELADFYRTDVLVPGQLMVDGDTYADVGVSFRGNSSFFTVDEGKKRSINLVMDFSDETQSLGGYRTLNLLNAHTDPSFLREVTFNYVARHYIPAPKANFVRVVINGEDWGVYVNSQQMNKDFTAEWFGSKQGVRWKIRAGGGARALNYNGDDPEAYKSLYEAKSNETDRAWSDLIRACRDLETIPVEELDLRLDRILDLDRALWFLAMDNVLIDKDGYYTRGSDYMVYQEPKYGRFHLLPYDSNETFRYPSGSGPGGGAPIQVEGVELSPFAGEENEARPLLNRLMANKRIRARYLAHVRTIVDEWFESTRLEETFDTFHSLIADLVATDTRKLYSTDDFLANLSSDIGSGRRATPGLKAFVSARRDYFRTFPELDLKAPVIDSVERELFEQAPKAGQPIGILASLSETAPADKVLLYYSPDKNARFKSVPMVATERSGQFRGEVPAMPAGSRIHYYVEARRGTDQLASRFWPRNTVLGAASYRIVSGGLASVPLVINEVMPSNVSVSRDPQGDFDDWVEIYNPSDREVNVGGMFLTDNQENLRQWQFPKGTVVLPRAFIIVWADGDVGKRGLHADFKLSANGETVFLVDSDERGNSIVDQLTYMGVGKNEAFGRLDSGELAVMPPTPGRGNR